MSRILIKVILVIGLVLICLTLVWVFLAKSRPVQAKEAIEVRLLHPAADPGARPLNAAGFAITVSQIISSGFVLPVQVTNADDGSNRLFVVEQYGRIRIINSPVATPFLDIRSIVRSPEDSGGSEEGLLSVAFHPNYEVNGYFYVDYDNNNGDIVVARYSVSANPNIANPLSATPLLTIPHPTNDNHNGGQLFFGPSDGYLYISTGDGGGSGDSPNNAQNVNQLLGKILRIDVDSGSPYAIPAGNPFAGATPGADEIWALGLRNPWRFSFDRANGDMYIGDVGQDMWEEISYQAAGTPGGVNFGWRCREGRHNYNFSGNCGSLTLTEPITEYDHSLGIAVTGGYVYRGSLYPALQGYYFFADYGSGRIWSLTKTGPTTWSNLVQELDTTLNISAFGEDEAGELYVVAYNGSIRRLADVNGSSPNLATSTKSASAAGADPGETLTYTLLLKNTGGAPSSQPVTLTDAIPPGLVYVPGSLAATQGSVDDSLNPTLRWQGAFSPSANITVTYRVTATGAVIGLLTNQATLTSPGMNPITLTHKVFVPRPIPSYFPLIYK
ncbi:MAG: PQQ-dependent sugar dehydrogenase [Chloroflexi bacterium]|nr:PQQ-dependent sugar dehydrogenase [Chloroflexota bacterium]